MHLHRVTQNRRLVDVLKVEIARHIGQQMILQNKN